MAPLTAFPTREALMAAAAQHIGEALAAGLAQRGHACAALSGGSTPEPAYQALAALPLNWPAIIFALVDERCLPPSDPASNEAMLRRALAPALARGARLLPLYAEGATPEAAARRAEAAYAPLHIDIAVMGMGVDGHTASWFPGADGLSEALDPAGARAVIALQARQAAGATARLSLTLAALARAERALLLITGAEKRARLEAAQAQRPEQAPEQAPVRALCEALAGRLNVFWAA